MKSVPLLTLGGTFTIDPSVSISAYDEAAKHQYKMVEASGERWLYNDEVWDAGAHIYVEGGPNSRGFGGSIVSFQLLDGTLLKLRGPWHSNSGSLYEATKIDLRNRHATWGCVGKGRGFSNAGYTQIIDLVYFDSSITEGEFSRIENLAQKLSIECGQELSFYSESNGGSMCATVSPLLRKE